jgi:hypothetical protein
MYGIIYRLATNLLKKRIERIYNTKAKFLHANISRENSNKETDITQNSCLHRKRNRKRLPLKLRQMRMRLLMQSSIISEICCFLFILLQHQKFRTQKQKKYSEYVFESEEKQHDSFTAFSLFNILEGFRSDTLTFLEKYEFIRIRTRSFFLSI